MTASTIALVILSLAVIAALLYPLIVSAAKNRRVSRGPSELDALLRRKAVLYANMKDLEFEHQMGKLSVADYERLRSDDRAEAARLLQEIDALEEAGDADALIEREIAARQFGARDDATAALAERVAEGGAVAAGAPAASRDDERAAVFCASCGARSRGGDRFCWRCGAAIYAGEES